MIIYVPTFLISFWLPSRDIEYQLKLMQTLEMYPARRVDDHFGRARHWVANLQQHPLLVIDRMFIRKDYILL